MTRTTEDRFDFANDQAHRSDSLLGLRALIFGGGSGIGLGIARWLARDGASVTIASRDTARLQSAAARLEQIADPSASIAWIHCDATDEDSVASTVAEVVRDGGIQICVTSVGGSTNVPLLLCSAEVFRQDLDRNLTSVFLAIKHAGSAMAQGGGGSFVAISSDAAKLSFPYVGPYCAAKAGVDQLIRVAADEIGHTKVRFNAVRPGLIVTERNTYLAEDKEVHDHFVAEKVLGRLGTVDDVAAAVRYLVGPEASWVTGQSFAIDGGNELRKAASLESVARKRYGDEAIDAVLRGEIVSASPKT